ncbi:dermonecrotic toxin domain-containing protein [Pseudomonas sp. NPDC087029]|uniref:dermonecrotic toxin domain-containing protein n=1 Tax=Pseudomonas sp. NPDC087029 TaxID=3364433 RepID=UPI0037F75C76
MPSTFPDLHAAVAAAFSDCPTVRQIAGREALKLLAERYDSVRSAKLADADALVLHIPSATTDAPSWTPRPLLDALLTALFQGCDLRALGKPGGEFMLSVSAPFAFKDALGNPLEDAVVSVQQAMDELEDLVLLLPWHLRQAQVDFWQANGSLGVSRDLWLQQQLKSALLGNLPLQGLDGEQVALVLGLLEGSLPPASVFAVQVQEPGSAVTRMLPNLLVLGEWDERLVLLWCAPCGVIRPFTSFDDFALALCQMQGADSLTWHRFALEGDVFAQQAALLLDCQFEALDGWRLDDGAGIDQGEAAYASVGNPAHYFIAGYGMSAEVPLKAPPGLANAPAGVSFAYQRGMFELALAQAASKGQGSAAGVLDLQAFARKRLREALLEDYPVEANYFPDDLVLTLSSAIGMPGSGWGTVFKRTMTLTEFAIGNLASLQGAVLERIEHRDEQLIMPWLTADYLKALVERIDVGGSYVAYVQQAKADQQGKAQREACFSREWRCSMLFSGLLARLDGGLSEAGLECLVDFCRGQFNRPGIEFMPLALRRTPGPEQADRVHGMYVLFAPELEVVLLYRPLYMQGTLREFPSLDALRSAIARPGALQDSVLDWMSGSSRDAYGRGDFDALFLPELPGGGLPVPVRVAFSAEFWTPAIDQKLYQASLDLLLELAARESLSTAQSRWAVLLQGGWLLFDTVTLFMGGPVAVVAWLVQGLSMVRNDLPALLRGNEAERSVAVVDLLLGLAAGLMHGWLPRPVAGAGTARALQARRGSVPFSLEQPLPPAQGQLQLAGAMATEPGRSLDFSFRGAQGFNVLGKAMGDKLRGMRASVDLAGKMAESNGLYRLDSQYYVALAGENYRVEFEGDQVRIIDAEGNRGPLLVRRFGAWRVDGGLHLRGGMPRSRVQQIKEANARKMAALNQQDKDLILQSKKLEATFKGHRTMLEKTKADLLELAAVEQPEPDQIRRKELLKGLEGRYREIVVYDLKALIENGLQHDQVLDEISALPRHREVMEQALRQGRANLRQEMIQDCESFYNEMAAMINQEEVGELANRVCARPELEQEVKLYEQFFEVMAKVVKWESDMVQIARQFDAVLERTLKDDAITFTDQQSGLSKHAWLGRIVEQRRQTGIELEFQLLMDIGELCLDRLGVGVHEHVLEEYEHYLKGAGLRSAGAAHGDPARAEVARDEQINILNGVVDAYAEADAMASYLRSLGGAAVRPERLDQYRALLNTLKDSAEKELVAAVQEQELLEQRPLRQPIYAPRGGRRHVVRTHRGRSVVGVERERDGTRVLEQLDDRANVLKTFRLQGAEWVEDVSVEESERRPSLGLAQERELGKRLIEQVESVIGLGRQYERHDEPLGLATVIDGHIDKLEEVRANFTSSEADQALEQNLSHAIERLATVKRDKLVSLYLATSHPTAQSLRFLLQEKKVRLSRQGARRKLSATDFLDVYEVRRNAEGSKPGRLLWEAHFHYPAADTPEREFSKGHLKLGYQSKLGREAQMRAAASGKEVLAIYRGNLRLADVEGLIPFDA